MTQPAKTGSAGADPQRPGAVWLRRAPTAPAERARPLTRDAIVATAIALADAEGLEAVSIRRIAGELGARPMSLYSHISRKQELIDLMFDAVVAETLLPPGEQHPADWQEALRAIANRTADALRRHRWMLSTPWEKVSFGPHGLRHLDESLAALAGLDVDLTTKISILHAVDTFTLGHVVQEFTLGHAAAHHHSEPGGAVHYILELIAQGNYQHLAGASQHFFYRTSERDADNFNRGLDYLLAGIAAHLNATTDATG